MLGFDLYNSFDNEFKVASVEIDYTLRICNKRKDKYKPFVGRLAKVLSFLYKSASTKQKLKIYSIATSYSFKPENLTEQKMLCNWELA